MLGLIGVYMLLALQFRGYLAPITVMLVIPTALIGVVFGHLALGIGKAAGATLTIALAESSRGERLLQGCTARVRLERHWETLGLFTYRKLIRFMDRLRDDV